jgi:uncharacterized protein YxeA
MFFLFIFIGIIIGIYDFFSGLIFGAVASFFLSKELHLENRNPFIISDLTKYNEMTKYNEQSDYSVVDPNTATISITAPNSDQIHSDDAEESRRIVSEGDNNYSICNQIDTRRPFATSSEEPSMSEYKSNDYDLNNLSIDNHMEISANSQGNTNPAWSSRISQYNPFVSDKDRYQKIPEVTDV